MAEVLGQGRHESKQVRGEAFYDAVPRILSRGFGPEEGSFNLGWRGEH